MIRLAINNELWDTVRGALFSYDMSFLSKWEERELIHTAEYSIKYGLKFHKPYRPDINKYTENLRKKLGTFVTLLRKDLPKENNLRGCIGTVDPSVPLIVDVSLNAYNAAFKDPRFSPVREEELEKIHIKISILSPFQKILVKNLEELYEQIEPNKDGILLKSPDGRATFLPDVWDKVPNKERFIKELYKKANLPYDYPFSKIRWFKYTTIHVE